MGISETIVAAMIGAIATVTTAVFQLVTAWRNRGKVDSRPNKRGMTVRSILAVLALMVASAAGGFLYSDFIKQRNAEDMRAMRQELKELKDLTARFADEQLGASAPELAGTPTTELSAAVTAAMQSPQESVESVVYVPACRRSDAGAVCSETDAQRLALCGTIPAFARVDRIDLFVQPDAVQDAWEEHRAQFDQDLGGARFTGKSFEYAQGQDQKAVCVNFMHWSSDHPHIARILVQFGFGQPPVMEAMPAIDTHDPGPAQTPAVIAADTLSPIPQAAAFTEASSR
jgi:hypothetical protein